MTIIPSFGKNDSVEKNILTLTLCFVSASVVLLVGLLLHYFRSNQETEKNEEFTNAIKNFKRENNIKSLRTQVFGISLNPDTQQKILTLRQKLFKIDVVRHRISDKQLNRAVDVELLTKYEKIILQLITNADLKQCNDKKTFNTFEYLAKDQVIGDNPSAIYAKWAELNQIPVVAQFARKKNGRAITPSTALFTRKNGYMHLPFNFMNAMTNSQEIINEMVIGENLKNNCIILHYAKSNKEGKLELFGKDKEEATDIYTKLSGLKNDKLNITFNLTRATSSNYSGEYHVSIFVSYKLGKEIKIINIDAYDTSWYVYNYSQEKSVTRVVVRDKAGTELQTPSWSNMNCGIYSANIANIIIETLSEVNKDTWGKTINNKETYKKINHYFDENGSKLYPTNYHNEVRKKVADKYMKEYFKR